MNFCKFIILFVLASQSHATLIGMGIGGGGALAGISFDPLNPQHLYIGTDMGLVYESLDLGKNWTSITQKKIRFSADLSHQSHMGFGLNGTLYWATGGCNPQISQDKGVSWQSLKTLNSLLPENCLEGTTRIGYWFFSPTDAKIIGVGTSSGVLLSIDGGDKWTHLFGDKPSLESMIVDKSLLYHASEAGLYKYNLQTGEVSNLLETSLATAAMGKDSQGLTLVGVEKTDKAQKKLFIKPANKDTFYQQDQPVGKFVKMSRNNSSIIYFTGNSNADEGAAIWMSEDSGAHWEQRFTDDQTAYNSGKINANPIGLFIGFWDSDYNDFQVAPNNPKIVACSGNFFFKVSTDKGDLWQYPYAQLKIPTKAVSKMDFWRSTQFNPVTVYFLKRNPANPLMIVAGLADIGCILSQDNGYSWRMCNIPRMNSIYDIVFNPKNPNQLYAAASAMHDFPQDWHADIQNLYLGGIYVSEDLGINWTLLSPKATEYQNPYLSLAIDFNQSPCQIYAGTQGKGIIASSDCGDNWHRLNNGFEALETSINSSDQKGSLIFPSIQISPLTGDVYALHTGNRLWQKATNPFLNYTGLYKLDKKSNTWKQLGRSPMKQGPDLTSNLYWKYPFSFAVDWQNPKRLYLVDRETAGTWKIAGLWSSTNEGKTWQQVLQFSGARKVYFKENKVCVVGWSDQPEDPFMYCSIDKDKFTPMSIDLPLQKVNDVLFDENGFFFATFGGGIFRWSLD